MTLTLHAAVATVRTELRDSEQHKSIVLAVIAQCYIRATLQTYPGTFTFEQMEQVGKIAGEMVLEEILKQ